MMDDDFKEWLKGMPASFVQYLYEIYLLNEYASEHGVPPDSVGMSIQGDNFRMVFTKQPIKAPDWFTKSNGIDETLDKDK
jgi:hypothetical protein